MTSDVLLHIADHIPPFQVAEILIGIGMVCRGGCL